MLKCPIDYVRDNLVFGNDKSCWAIYELTGFNYDLLSVESKVGVLNRLTLFISGIAAEAKFMVIPVTQDLETHFKGLAERLDKKDPLNDYAMSFAMNTKDYLIAGADEQGAANDYKTFVSVKLQRDSEEMDSLRQLKDSFDFAIKAVFNDINAFAGTDAADISAGRIREHEKLAGQILRDQSRRIEIKPADSHIVWWLLRRSMYRGLPEDGQLYAKRLQKYSKQTAFDIELAGQKFIRPRTREVANLFSGVIKKHGRSLKVEHDGKTSYQTFLTITGIPEELNFPDNEWIYFFNR